MTSTIHEQTAPALLMALELGRREWKLGFGSGLGRSMRRRTLRADSWRRVAEEIAAAKAHFGVSAEAPVISCDEAGLDGFWVHRYLTSLGVTNLVVDSSSIEVNRRARRAKTDRLDVERLLLLLLRYVGGERSALRVVHVPSDMDEQGRQLHRELLAVKRDRTRVTNRITGLLATQGMDVSVRANFRVRLEQMTRWNGQPLPTVVRTRLVREWQKVE
jgi:transposase